MIRIIPAIDIIEGKCVRLSEGDFDRKKVYDQDPVNVAQRFEEAGVSHLHLVDLDGARQKKIVNWTVLEKIASKTDLQIDFGGGVQSDQDLRTAFDCGAQQITAGSIAVKEESVVLQWLEEYGSEKIILGADSKEGKIAVSGWTEITVLNLHRFLSKYVDRGIRYAICTDVTKDGLLQGTNLNMYRAIKQKLPHLFLIASGGVTQIDEIESLDRIGVNGVIIGKALYEGQIELSQLKDYLC
ncbi:MAG: 1-(5-phosphoribosyl)-5-[(5-phosphoribosylamino)methylideneamino]imidazole-4-carboxamide isomerase [Calditrichia bacterium]|nr:1-(5-phosphoribosyl)-5-[(5-phosphoribosylamino)methylideneamino]imidazole-4-carboxamide isomerase [Calditrichia bacterium]